MKRFLAVVRMSALYITCICAFANAQCDQVDSIFGYAPVPSGSASFGDIVEPAGDLNKDGYADILVAGVKDYFSVDASVTVFSGLTGDSLRLFYKGNNTVRGASYFGDYNKDTYPDYLINAVVYSGNTGDTLKAFGNQWMSGKSAGDVDNDGIHDVLVVINYTGYVFSGVTGDTLHQWGGYFRFGESYTALGDVNGDGFDDVAFGYPESSGKRGRVLVYSGFDGSELMRISHFIEYQEFGYNVESAGDLDGDGFPDLLVAGQSENSLTAPVTVWAYSVKKSALLYTVDGKSHGASYLDKFGYAMDGIGDITNDGYEDFAVGAFRQASNRGNVYVFSGADGSYLYETRNRFTKNILMGKDVAGVGDTDGDGSPDFAVGCPWMEAPEDPTNDTEKRGGIYLYRCSYPPGECQVADDFDGDIWDNDCDNCKWFVNFDQSDSDVDGVGDQCDESANLQEGKNRTIIFSRNNWDWSGYWPQLTFDTVIVSDSAYFHATPLTDAINGFTGIPYAGPLQYSFSTDAVYDGTVTVKVPYLDTGLTIAQEQELQLYQEVDGVWRNITSSGPVTNVNTITGVTYSLGEFAVGGCLPTPDSDGDNIGDLCDNCPFIDNHNQEDLNGNGIGDVCESSVALPAGANESTDLAAGGDDINLNFDQIDTGGEISVEVTSIGPPTSSYFELYPSDPPKYYEFTTDIGFSGEVTITIGYDDAGLSAAQKNSLRLWHYDGGWIDITTEHIIDSSIIRGVATSFSPFALGLEDIHADVSDGSEAELPEDFQLSQNYPNPFNPQTTVMYTLAYRTNVRIDVFNILGQKVRTLVDESKSAGSYRVTWDGRNENGETISSGVYLYRMTTDKRIETKKMLLLR